MSGELWALVGLVTLLGLVALRDAMHGDRRRKEEDALQAWHARRIKERAEQRAKEQTRRKSDLGDGRNW